MSKSEKQKMATSWEIYNRIIWDSRLDSSVFMIGYEDRISKSGIREKPLVNWAVDGDIPWHRIQYISCKDIIVWDREQHLDLISSGHLPPFAWNHNQTDESDKTITNIEEQPATFNQKSVYKYESDFVRPWTGISKIQNTAIVTLSLNAPSDYDLISIETRFARVFIAIWS